MNLPILFEDEYVICIDKPAGTLTVPDRFNPKIPSLMTALKVKYPDIIPVHRIDKFTSGVNLLAKDAESHRTLSIAFQEDRVEKYYSAIVDGIPHPESGIIDIPISESTVTRGKMIVHPRGKSAKTAYKILQTFGNYSFLYLQLFTGRTHQIRVHLQYLGHPLIVDPLYGNRDAFYLSEVKHKKYKISKYQEEKPLLLRQPLHAQKIVFPHPISSDMIEIESQIPKDMRAILHQFDKLLHH